MEIQTLDLLACEKNGSKWFVSMNYNPSADCFKISWNKMESDAKVLRQGKFFVPATFEEYCHLTNDSLPGCVPGAVQVIVAGGKKPRGLQFLNASRLPLSPNGKTLLGYIDLLKKFPGFECVGNLVKTLERGEEFLDGIPIHANIKLKATIANAT